MEYARKILNQVGLSKTEVDVYIAGLEIGPSTAANIAQRAQTKRPLVYHTLQLLEQKGLISKFGPKHGQLFTMEPPEKLDGIIDYKKRELELIKDKLVRAKSELKKIVPSPAHASRVKFYEGINGIKSVAQDTLTAKQIYAFVSIENVLSLLDREFLEYWIDERKKRNITSRTIWSKHQPGFLIVKDLQEIKIAPNTMDIPATILIYDNKVVIFSSGKELSAFVVENKSFATTQKSAFEEIWKISTPPTV